MRVYQVADEARISNRVLVQLLQDRGVEVASHMAPLSSGELTILDEIVAEIRKDSPLPVIEREPEPEEAVVAVEPPPVEEAEPEPVVEAEAESEAESEAETEVEVEPEVAEPAAEAEAEAAPEVKAEPEAVAATPEVSPDAVAAKPTGRKVRKIQEREVIEQSLQEMEEEKKPEEPKKKKAEPTRPGPDRTRTYRFHKRGGHQRTLRRKPRGPREVVMPTGPVEVTLPISVKDFSQALGVKVNEILRVLMLNGVMANINAHLDQDTVDVLALEFDREVTVKHQVAAEEAFLTDIEGAEDRPEDLKPRAPIVAMLGHVDHGKTSLLDYIRKTDVAAKEAGGITQHISSYKIRREDNRELVFIDLPGHEAFTHMRGRGAQATDIVILVVAAEEGVMPQTEECINHARAAGVPVIVALNKCDKAEANPSKVKQLLSSYGLIAEEWGGDVLMVETSAVTGQGIDDLLEAVLLQAELMEYMANPHKKASGTVLEAEKSEGRGILATVLVQDGSLRPGDLMLAGTGYGRVRDIRDDLGRSIPIAGPATPVEISGLSQVPEAGDRFYVIDTLSQAKAIAAERTRKKREDSLASKQTLSLADLFRKAGETATSEVPIIVKGDTKGSVEAISQKLESLANSEVKIKILHGAVGTVNESDVQLASASEAIILGFNVIAEERGRSLAHERGVEINFYQIIYELVDDVKKAMENQLAPEQREIYLGQAEVRQVFISSRLGKIAGCHVVSGILRRKAGARVSRDGRVIHDRSRVSSLRRFKDDVKEVREGFECGLKVSGYEDLKEGDIVEVFEVQEFARTLEDAAQAQAKAEAKAEAESETE